MSLNIAGFLPSIKLSKVSKIVFLISNFEIFSFTYFFNSSPSLSDKISFSPETLLNNNSNNLFLLLIISLYSFISGLNIALPSNLSILHNTGSNQLFWNITPTPFLNLETSNICSSVSNADFPTNLLSLSSGNLKAIFVFVFLIADSSKLIGAWSTITNPSPNALISAIPFDIISTDFCWILLPSELPWLDFFNKLCASSITVKCFNSLVKLLLFNLSSYSFKNTTPIIRDLVSNAPILLKSIITFELNNSSLLISFPLKILPTNPVVKLFTLVTRDPI